MAALRFHLDALISTHPWTLYQTPIQKPTSPPNATCQSNGTYSSPGRVAKRFHSGLIVVLPGTCRRHTPSESWRIYEKEKIKKDNGNVFFLLLLFSQKWGSRTPPIQRMTICCVPNQS
jgi:hypothetical protein